MQPFIDFQLNAEIQTLMETMYSYTHTHTYLKKLIGRLYAFLVVMCPISGSF